MVQVTVHQILDVQETADAVEVQTLDTLLADQVAALDVVEIRR